MGSRHSRRNPPQLQARKVRETRGSARIECWFDLDEYHELKLLPFIDGEYGSQDRAGVRHKADHPWRGERCHISGDSASSPWTAERKWSVLWRTPSREPASVACPRQVSRCTVLRE